MGDLLDGDGAIASRFANLCAIVDDKTRKLHMLAEEACERRCSMC